MDMKSKLVMTAAAILLSCCGGREASGAPPRDTLSVTVQFGINNLGGIGRASLDALLDSLRKTGSSIEWARVEGYASPEGDTEKNRILSEDRAHIASEILSERFPGVTPGMAGLGEDWDGLYRALSASGRADRRMLAGMLSLPDRKERLRTLEGGSVWEQLKRDVFPPLRRAEVRLVAAGPSDAPVPDPGGSPLESVGNGTEPPDGDDADGSSNRGNATENIPVEPAAEDAGGHSPAIPDGDGNGPVARRPLFAVGTNVLYDAALMPNVSLEIPVRNRISLTASHLFPWWVSRDNGRALQVLHTTAGVRWWLGDRDRRGVLSGWYAGAEAGLGYGDLEPHGKGRQWEGVSLAGEGGYAFDLGRGWRLDLGLGLGTAFVRYRGYTGWRSNRYLLHREDGRTLLFGPSRVRVEFKKVLFSKSQSR